MAHRTINVGDFTEFSIRKLVSEDKATKEGNVYTIDISKMGYDKLLGAGETTLKLKVHAQHWSSSAEEKIKAAGGEIVAA